MEDVLAVYCRPYDPQHPVICVDEKSKELHADRPEYPPVPARPGQVTRLDYEYDRCGTANIFMAVEPLTGQRHVGVTAQRTKLDFAAWVRYLADEVYPDVAGLVLVVDNLNTHGPWSLYERWDPAEARRIVERIEWHYTPEHGSWLNMAEIELSVLERQCLRRRFADAAQLAAELTAWEEARNEQERTIRWQFTTADARIKLRRLYPSINT
jgi:hypothetical protein